MLSKGFPRLGGATLHMTLAALITNLTLAICSAPATPAITGGNATAGHSTSDAQFIDSMIPHHESAISMAQEALKTSQRAKIKALATAIVAAQTAKI